jgi:hypothetical protein
LFLSRNSRAYMGTMVGFLANERHFDNFRNLTDAVRRGGTAGAKGDNKMPDDQLWVSFARSMASITVPAALFIAHLVGAQEGQPSRVLDVAAGHGMYGITLASRTRKHTSQPWIGPRCWR